MLFYRLDRSSGAVSADRKGPGDGKRSHIFSCDFSAALDDKKSGKGVEKKKSDRSYIFISREFVKSRVRVECRAQHVVNYLRQLLSAESSITSRGPRPPFNRNFLLFTIYTDARRPPARFSSYDLLSESLNRDDVFIVLLNSPKLYWACRLCGDIFFSIEFL